MKTKALIILNFLMFLFLLKTAYVSTSYASDSHDDLYNIQNFRDLVLGIASKAPQLALIPIGRGKDCIAFEYVGLPSFCCDFEGQFFLGNFCFSKQQGPSVVIKSISPKVINVAVKILESTESLGLNLKLHESKDFCAELGHYIIQRAADILLDELYSIFHSEEGKVSKTLGQFSKHFDYILSSLSQDLRLAVLFYRLGVLDLDKELGGILLQPPKSKQSSTPKPNQNKKNKK